MSKLIFKTAAITLASVIGVCSLVIGILMLCSPRTIANVLDGMGGYSASVYFYEKQYDKTESVNDLSCLILKIDGEKDPFLLEKYLGTMIGREDFNNFCVEQDANSDSDITTKEYYHGNYAVILVKNGKFSEAVNVANDFVRANGYTEYNPYSVMISQVGSTLTKANISTLKSKVRNHKYSLSGEAEARAQADLLKIEELIKLIG